MCAVVAAGGECWWEIVQVAAVAFAGVAFAGAERGRECITFRIFGDGGRPQGHASCKAY